MDEGCWVLGVDEGWGYYIILYYTHILHTYILHTHITHTLHNHILHTHITLTCYFPTINMSEAGDNLDLIIPYGLAMNLSATFRQILPPHGPVRRG